MKNKSEYIKRVYKRWPSLGCYLINSDQSINLDHSLARDFPAIYRVLVEYDWIKLDFEDHARTGVCYIDKHGNVIVRYRLNNVLQTKIDF